MSRTLAAVAARVVGRRVRLCPGAATRTGTITRVTGRGLTVTFTGLTSADVDWIDD